MLLDLNTWLTTSEEGDRHGAGHIAYLASIPGVGAGHGIRHSALIMCGMVISLYDLNTWLATLEGGARHGAGNIVYLASNPGVGGWAWYKTKCFDLQL